MRCTLSYDYITLIRKKDVKFIAFSPFLDSPSEVRNIFHVKY